MTFTKEHDQLFHAIEMWHDTLTVLCNEKFAAPESYDYTVFISNAKHNLNREKHTKQAIDDFYDYFYTKTHICDINYIHGSFGRLDNHYGLGEHKMKLLDMLQNIQNKTVFQKITLYVFNLCIIHRDTLKLPVMEDDEHIIRYLTRQDVSPAAYDL
jgi:hypothetical protein